MLTIDKLLTKAIKDQKAKTDYGCISVWKYVFLNIRKKIFKLYKKRKFSNMEKSGYNAKVVYKQR